MGEITFPKNDLKGLLASLGKFDGYEVVEDHIVGTGRWSENHRMVFTYDGGYYATTYSVGSTEMQDEDPYDYTDDEVEPGRIRVTPVRPVERVVIAYEAVS